MNAQEAKALSSIASKLSAESVAEDQVKCIKSHCKQSLHRCPVISLYWALDTAERNKFVEFFRGLGYIVDFQTSEPSISW